MSLEIFLAGPWPGLPGRVTRLANPTRHNNQKKQNGLYPVLQNLLPNDSLPMGPLKTRKKTLREGGASWVRKLYRALKAGAPHSKHRLYPACPRDMAVELTAQGGGGSSS